MKSRKNFVNFTNIVVCIIGSFQNAVSFLPVSVLLDYNTMIFDSQYKFIEKQ